MLTMHMEVGIKLIFDLMYRYLLLFVFISHKKGKKHEKKCKSIIAILMTICLMMLMCCSVFAATKGNNYPYTSSRQLQTTTSWKTLATSTKGFDCNVFIKCENTVFVGLRIAKNHVRMLDKNGNILWEESGAIKGSAQRIFKCGSDVYTIQIRTEAGKGLAYAYETTKAPT